MLGFDPGSRSSRLALALGVVAGCVLLCGVGFATRAGAKGLTKGKSVCRQVALDSRRSCRAAALDDYWTAIAKCDNAGEAGQAPDSCKEEARGDLFDAYQECADQLSARNDICAELGGAAYDPQIDPAQFSSTLSNPYLEFTVGKTFHYRTDLGGGDVETDDVTVTPDTRMILGVECRAVRDVVALNRDVTEDTTDWYAQDAAGNVWYFGEESKQYEDGVLVSLEGSWMAGADDALPGIVFEANPTPGDFYRQEYAINEAEDVAKVVALGQSVVVPYGSYVNATETEETSGLEPSALEHKFYEPGVGQLLTVDEETGQREELIGITP